MSGSTDRLPYCDIDAILNVWFEKCDQIESGQVKTVSLVERAKAYLDNNQEKERDQKRKLEDLTRRLDPRSDNGYVDRETFLRVAKEWVEMVVRVSKEMPCKYISTYNEYVDNTGWGLAFRVAQEKWQEVPKRIASKPL